MAGYGGSLLIVDVVFGLVCGVLGYLFSQRYGRAHGFTPWRLPSWLWFLLLFFLGFIGILLYLIAAATTRPRSGPNDWSGRTPRWDPQSSGFGGPPPQGWNPPPPGPWGPTAPQGWDAPSPGGWEGPPPGSQGAPPPGGWDAPPPQGTVFPGFSPTGSTASTPGAPPSMPPLPPPPRSWLPDPSGRHELRYWDGTKFTEHVADAGKISVDPL